MDKRWHWIGDLVCFIVPAVAWLIAQHPAVRPWLLSRMRAEECSTLSVWEVTQWYRHMLSLPIVAEQTERNGEVEVRFSFAGSGNHRYEDNNLLVVYSEGLEKVVYRGPYRVGVRFRTQEREFGRLRFMALFASARRLCLWSREFATPPCSPPAPTEPRTELDQPCSYMAALSRPSTFGQIVACGASPRSLTVQRVKLPDEDARLDHKRHTPGG